MIDSEDVDEITTLLGFDYLKLWVHACFPPKKRLFDGYL